jgi:hypothetical protein
MKIINFQNNRTFDTRCLKNAFWKPTDNLIETLLRTVVKTIIITGKVREKASETQTRRFPKQTETHPTQVGLGTLKVEGVKQKLYGSTIQERWQ